MVDSAFALLRRVVNVIAVLLEAHLTLARHEAEKDMARLAAGLVVLFFAGLCFSSVWLLLQALAVMGLMAGGLSAVVSLAAVAGGNLLLGGMAAAVGRDRLSKPIMPESRSLMAKTFDALID